METDTGKHRHSSRRLHGSFGNMLNHGVVRSMHSFTHVYLSLIKDVVRNAVLLFCSVPSFEHEGLKTQCHLDMP